MLGAALPWVVVSCSASSSRPAPLSVFGDRDSGAEPDVTTAPSPEPEAGLEASVRDAGSDVVDAEAQDDAAATWLDTGLPVPETQPSALAMAVAAGLDTSCALTTEGQVRCWGSNSDQTFATLGYPPQSLGDEPYPIAVPGLEQGVSLLASSPDFSCGAFGTAGVSCWGSFWVSDGLGGFTYKDVTATPIMGWGSVTSLTVGDAHACGLTVDGGAECFGGNTHGEVGDQTQYVRVSAVPVTVVTGGIRKIVAGGNSTCVITTDGGLGCFGRNDEGELGDGTRTGRLLPVTPIGMDADVADVSTNEETTCAVKTDGSVYCWGINTWGTLGLQADASAWTDPADRDDSGSEDLTIPTQVVGVSNAVAVRVGPDFACAILQDHTLMAWGNISNSMSSYVISAPTPLTGIADVKDVALGQDHFCVLLTSGGVQCEGNNDFGQLGDGLTASTSAPVDVSSLP